MADSATVDKSKMFTAHGDKKFQGVWMKVNDVPSLTYATVKGEEVQVLGYTTIDEMLKMAYSPDIPNIKL